MNTVSTAIRLFRMRRDFALLMAVQFCAQAGDGFVQAALAKLIVFGGQRGFDLESARSPDELLRIALLLFVPYAILSPLLGVVIDRWERNRLLALTGSARAIALFFVALVGTERVGDSFLFLAFLFTLASTRVALATKAAALPETVDDEELVDANAISQLGGAMFQLVAAGAAVVSAGFLAAEIPLAAGAIVYGVGAMAATRIGKLAEPRSVSSVWVEIARVGRSIGEGLLHVARSRQAGAAIATYFWLRLLWSFAIVAIGFVARDLLANDDLLVVILTGGAGATGAVTGFVTAQSLRSRLDTIGMLVVAAALLMGAAVAVLGALRFEASIALLAFFLGYGFFLAKISLDTLVQRALGDDFRGRAFALYDIAYNLGWIIAAAILKLFWTPTGQSLLIASVGVLYLVGTAVLATWFRRVGLLRVPAPDRV